MTVNYCGSCGAANGAAARFCRQCGTDLNAQTAKSGTEQPRAAASKAAGSTSGKPSDSSARPQLRIVSSPTNTTGVAAAEPVAPSQPSLVEAAIPPPPPAPPLPRRVLAEELRRKRAAQIVEQKQEADARALKQTAAGSLSQRLAQAATAKPTTESPPAQTKPPTAGAPIDESVATRSSGALAANPVPRVRTAPLPPKAARNSGPLQTSGPNSGKLSMPSSAAVAEASGLREHPQAGLFLRVAAIVLVVLLLGSGGYIYRNQKAGAANPSNLGRNLLSPEDQSEQLMQSAERARQDGQLETAAADLNKAIELTPDQPAPRQLLAETFAGAGRTDEALKAYDSLLKLTPDNLGARLKVAEIQRVKGNLNEARLQYQRIIVLNQASPEATRALEAIEEIDDTVAQATPGNPPPGLRPRRLARRKTLGPVLPPSTLPRGQVALVPQNPFAAPSARSFSNFNPLRPLETPDPKLVATHHKSLGQRYLNIGQFNAAIKELHEAVRLTPDDKDLYYFLGSSYKGLGQLVKAFEYYRKCDAGPYAETAQSGAKQIEKPARKEFERQQKELLKATQAKQAEARKEPPPSKSFQNSFQEQ